MESQLLGTAIKAITEQGILGVILIILFIMYKKLIEKLFKVIENNTVALQKNVSAIESMYKIISSCKLKGEKS